MFYKVSSNCNEIFKNIYINLSFLSWRIGDILAAIIQKMKEK